MPQERQEKEQIPQEQVFEVSLNPKEREAEVRWKGQPGWHVDRIVGEGDKRMLELGKYEINKKGQEVYKRELAYAKEVEKERFSKGMIVKFAKQPEENQQGWEITKVLERNGRIVMELGKNTKRGYETAIAYENEVELQSDK